MAMQSKTQIRLMGHHRPISRNSFAILLILQIKLYLIGGKSPNSERFTYRTVKTILTKTALWWIFQYFQRLVWWLDVSYKEFQRLSGIIPSSEKIELIVQQEDKMKIACHSEYIRKIPRADVNGLKCCWDWSRLIQLCKNKKGQIKFHLLAPIFC